VPAVAYALSIVVAYLLGSIPSGFLVARARGLDIRTVGSGNIGATNVFRYLGKPAGIFVLLADAVKGWLAVILATHVIWPLINPSGPAQAREWAGILAGLAAVLGHNFTIWLHFKGGKGIATSAGVLVALVPGALLITLAIWIVVFVASRYVSLASIIAAAALPFTTWVTQQSSTMIFLTGAMAALAIYKHKSNIQRLLNGTENRMGRKRAGAATITSDKAQ
jgi:acyl phosphate:glycerol-3-phosphate acyltransferase